TGGFPGGDEPAPGGLEDNVVCHAGIVEGKPALHRTPVPQDEVASILLVGGGECLAVGREGHCHGPGVVIPERDTPLVRPAERYGAQGPEDGQPAEGKQECTSHRSTSYRPIV